MLTRQIIGDAFLTPWRKARKHVTSPPQLAIVPVGGRFCTLQIQTFICCFDLRKLLSVASDVDAPSVSPNGKRIVVRMSDAHGTHPQSLSEIAADSTGFRTIVRAGPDELLRHGAWSPDGEYLVHRIGHGAGQIFGRFLCKLGYSIGQENQFDLQTGRCSTRVRAPAAMGNRSLQSVPSGGASWFAMTCGRVNLYRCSPGSRQSTRTSPGMANGSLTVLTRTTLCGEAAAMAANECS